RLIIESFQLPTFYNLTRLELAFYRNYVYPSLGWLKCTPILRVLVLCRDGMQPFPSEWFNAAEPVPLCLREHLKVIQYKGFQGDWDEIGMLKYMLKNGEVLSEILVGFCRLTARNMKKIKKNFRRMHKASETCTIQFSRLKKF
ncbi:FBD domain, partial [Dillenia turbinata]